MKFKNYNLLKFHMNCNPDYLFGHAEIAGMLASNDEEVNTYEKYISQCKRRGIDKYSEDCYNAFMKDCNRNYKKIINQPEHFVFSGDMANEFNESQTDWDEPDYF